MSAAASIVAPTAAPAAAPLAAPAIAPVVVGDADGDEFAALRAALAMEPVPAPSMLGVAPLPLAPPKIEPAKAPLAAKSVTFAAVSTAGDFSASPPKLGSSLMEKAAKRAAKRRGVPTAELDDKARELPEGGRMRWHKDGWFYDWQKRSPLSDSVIRSKLASALKDVRLVPGWVELEPGDDGFEPSTARGLLDTIYEFDDEDAKLDASMDALVIHGKEQSTLDGYRYPFLKAVFWLAVRDKPVNPPLAIDVARYLTVLVRLRANEGAPTMALRALNYVGSINGWGRIGSDSVVSIPMEAAARLFSGPTKKARALDVLQLADIVQKLIPNGLADITEDSPDGMMAGSLVGGFATIGRFENLCAMRYDDEYCEIVERDGLKFIEFFIVKEKQRSRKRVGRVCVVAQSDRAVFGGLTAFDILAHGKATHKTGPVLRRVGKRGAKGAFLDAKFFDPADRTDADGEPVCKNMMYKDYVAYFRSLLELIGLSKEEVEQYTSHSVRRGAATNASKADVPEHLIKNQAGVTAYDWLRQYDELDDARRCDASRAIGI